MHPQICALFKFNRMKNLLLTTTMLLFAVSSIAQLYVKPNGVNPSYVYVNDVQVYVEGAIDLTKNAVGDYESSVYLRGDAQLFQGGTSTYNSGDGLLSVYQTTNADQYDYNFWSSPVGLNAGGVGNTINGPLRLNVSNDLTVLPTDIGTTTFTSAWGGASSANSLTVSRTWLYKHLSDTADWQYIGGTDGVQPGYGFSMKGTNTTNHSDANVDPNIQQYDFRGRPNTGDITVNLTSSESTLVGNPYPSALDLAAFFIDNNSDGTVDIFEIQFWDENRSINSHYYSDNEGGYGTWVPAGAASGNLLQGMYTAAPFLQYDNDGNPDGGQNGSGATYPRRFSPIGQGFMINATATGSSATFTNSQRAFVAMDGTNSVFRSSETAAIKANSIPVLTVTNNDDESTEQEVEESSAVTNIPYMRLNAYFPGSHRREMALLFSEKATKGFDVGYDANHPMDASSEMAMTIEDGRKLVIQTIPWSADAIVPLMVKVDIPGSIVLSSYEETNLPFKKAYLFDAAQSTYQLITQGNTATANIAQAGETTNRFYIVFESYEQINVDTDEESGFTLAKESVDVFQDNRLAVMEILNPEQFDIKEAAVFDMSGKLVHTERNIGEQTRYSFPTAIFSDGIYIVKLTTQENLVLDYKVTIFNKR